MRKACQIALPASIAAARPARRTRPPQPTLIVFAREPIPGEVKTRLIPAIGAQAAAALAGAFVADTLAKARRLAPHALVIAGSSPGGVERSAYFRRAAGCFKAVLCDQGGGDLGARMRRVLEQFSGRGALLIGTDAPSLPVASLARSLDLLRQAPVVLAPSLDGGYYAIGTRGAVPDIFSAIRWSGGQVLAQTLTRLQRAGICYAVGPAWYDIDRWEDLLLLVEHLRRGAPSGRSAMRRGSGRGAHTTATPGGRSPCPATAGLLKKMKLL